MVTVEYNFLTVSDYSYPAEITVKNGVARLTNFPGYSTANPSIKLAVPLNFDFIDSLGMDAVVIGDDAIKIAVEIDGQAYWWDGAAWAESSGYEQSNTVAEVGMYAKNIEILDDTLDTNLIIYLHSDDGTTTPTLNSLVIKHGTYEEYLSSTAKCKVWGYVFDAEGLAVEGVRVRAKLSNAVVYNEDRLITGLAIGTTTNAKGFWQLSLIGNDNMRWPKDMSMGIPTYEFVFSGSGVKIVENKKVPSIVSKNYIELEDV